MSANIWAILLYVKLNVKYRKDYLLAKLGSCENHFQTFHWLKSLDYGIVSYANNYFFIQWEICE